MKPTAYIFDIDGTLALKGDRSPYDYSKVKEDKQNVPIIRLAWEIIDLDKCLFVTGRPDTCRADTKEWLIDNMISPVFYPTEDNLFMRDMSRERPKHMRPSYEVKKEIYLEKIKDKWDILAVFDDRDQDVAMWRSLGLLCLQVAPGDF